MCNRRENSSAKPWGRRRRHLTKHYTDGFSVMVPSGEEPDIRGCLKQADKVKLIRGTSDVIYGDEHMALIQRATRYAARYNALIARERGLSTAGGCWPSNIGVQRPPEDGRR